MNKNELTLSQKAEKIIIEKIEEVIKEKRQLEGEEDIRVETELKILLALTQKGNKEAESMDFDKEIEYIMKIFDKKFDELYKKCTNIQLEQKSNSKDIGER